MIYSTVFKEFRYFFLSVQFKTNIYSKYPSSKLVLEFPKATVMYNMSLFNPVKSLRVSTNSLTVQYQQCKVDVTALLSQKILQECVGETQMFFI